MQTPTLGPYAIVCLLGVCFLTGLFLPLRPFDGGPALEVVRLRESLHAAQQRLRTLETAQPPKAPAPRRPKYHVSALLSAHGVACQDHEKFLKGHNDPVVVECGAASGMEAAKLSHIARVYSFEANPANIPIIQHRVQEHGRATHLRVKHAACGNLSGAADLYVPQGKRHSQTASLANQEWWSGNKDKVKVPIVTLTDQIHEHVTLLKLDVQGAEPDVIDGARGLIETYGVDVIHMEFQPVLQLRHGRDPVRLLEMVYDLGYHCFECRFMRRVLSPNRDFHNFTHNNFVTPFEGRMGQGVVGGFTDLVCHSHLEAPLDRWRAKAVRHTVSAHNARDYPKHRN